MNAINTIARWPRHAKLAIAMLGAVCLATGCRALGPPAAQSVQAPLEARPALADAPPSVIAMSPVPLDRVARISRFRSGVGHDYSDGVERCRSMKHYFAFVGGEPGERHEPSWTTVPIVSPLDGTVVGVRAEWAGDQVRIRSAVDPRYTAVVFHVRRADGIVAGAVLKAGQAVGTHASDETMSDLAVDLEDPWTPQGRRLVSAFDGTVMGDGAFAEIAAHGVASRVALIIGAVERDADPLACDGERFATEGRIEGWVMLTAGGPSAVSVLPRLFVDR